MRLDEDHPTAQRIPPAQSWAMLARSAGETSLSPLHLSESPSCTYCHPDTCSPLGCLCCSGAAYKAPGILLVPVPAVQPLSVLRTERTAGIRPCSSGNILATIPKHHLWGKFTVQSPLHGGCHKHWLCSGSQKHPCGRFQKLNLHTWDMVHVRLQDPGVLPHRATCSHAQNYRERASLVAWHSKKALHALCPLSRGGVTFRPNETALKRSFFLTTQPACSSSAS